VFQHESTILDGQQRVDRHRHDTRIHCAQKADRPVDAIVHQQQHALFAANSASEQGGCQPADAFRKLAIAQGAGIVDVGGLGGARGVALDQVLREIEVRSQWLHLIRGCGFCGHVGLFLGFVRARVSADGPERRCLPAIPPRSDDKIQWVTRKFSVWWQLAYSLNMNYCACVNHKS